MSNQPSATAPAVQRINVTEMYEVRQWAERYACSPHELKAAVCVVGNVADDVRRYLAQRHPVPNGRAALEAAFQQGADAYDTDGRALS